MIKMTMEELDQLVAGREERFKKASQEEKKKTAAKDYIRLSVVRVVKFRDRTKPLMQEGSTETTAFDVPNSSFDFGQLRWKAKSLAGKFAERRGLESHVLAYSRATLGDEKSGSLFGRTRVHSERTVCDSGHVY
jgi:hypothetical protein